MAQELYRPGEKLPTEHNTQDHKNLNALIDAKTSEVNIFARWRAHLQSSKNSATVLVELKKNIAEIQSGVIQNYAKTIAEYGNRKIAEQFQARINEITRHVYERTTEETKYYNQKLKDQLDYYDDFFGKNIKEIEDKVTSGQIPKEWGEERIEKNKMQRAEQQTQDESIVKDLITASMRIVERAINDFKPS